MDAATLRTLARELAAAPTAAVYGRMGSSTVAHGTLGNWLVDVLDILTGNLDRPGGALFPLSATAPAPRPAGPGKGFALGRRRSRVSQHPEVKGELPLVALAEEIETPGEGKIRALITVASNPVLSAPDGQRLDAALDALDLMVAVDPYLNETTLAKAVTQEHSPAFGADPQEFAARLTGDTGPERRLDLMLRLGPYGLTLDEVRAHPHGIDLGPLKPRLPQLLRTRSGRIELFPAPIAADLPRLRAALDAVPDPGTLQLVGRRHLRSNNSWLHNTPALGGGSNRCTLQVHPDDAARLRLADGGLARIKGEGGELEVPVEVTDGVRPGVVSLPHGWGHDRPGTRLTVASARPGVNVNQLLDGSRLDPLSGTAVLNGFPVEVSPLP